MGCYLLLGKLSKVGNHPEIGSLIRKRDEIYNNLVGRNYPGALGQIRLMLRELDPEDMKDGGTELLEQVTNAYKKASRVSSGRYASIMDGTIAKLKVHYALNSDKYFRFYEGLNSLLWEKNYLSNEKYSFVDISGGRKSGKALL